MTYRPRTFWERINTRPGANPVPLDVFGKDSANRPDPSKVVSPEEIGIDRSQLTGLELERLEQAERRLSAAQEVRRLGYTEVAIAVIRGSLPEDRRDELLQQKADMRDYGNTLHKLASGAYTAENES